MVIPLVVPPEPDAVLNVLVALIVLALRMLLNVIVFWNVWVFDQVYCAAWLAPRKASEDQ